MTDLPDAIDETWRALLKRCAAVDADGMATVKISEQIEALQAAAKWLEIKAKLKPTVAEAPAQESKFDGIKQEFHGRAKRKPGNPWGRNGRPVEPQTERPGDTAETAEIIPINGGTPAAAEAGPGDGMAPASSLEH